MIIAIDFDGVIHDYKNPIKGRRMGAPIQGAKESIINLKNKGHTIIIFTVRANTPQSTKVVSDYLMYYKIPCHTLTNIKENFDIFIDDKAIAFQDWDTTNNLINFYETSH